MYSHPTLQHPQATHLTPGAIAEHKLLPGVALVVVSGPERGLRGDVYRVKLPDGRTVPVKRENLRT